jgi:hypothetical protein
MIPSIELVSRPDKPLWLVHACGMTFSFADPVSATAFSTKLAERVNAPHQIPPETLKQWEAEHSRMLRNS